MMQAEQPWYVCIAGSATTREKSYCHTARTGVNLYPLGGLLLRCNTCGKLALATHNS